MKPLPTGIVEWRTNKQENLLVSWKGGGTGNEEKPTGRQAKDLNSSRVRMESESSRGRGMAESQRG